MGTRVVTEAAGGTMRSPVNWALLGLVIQRPSYGYEFVQRFERTYSDTLALSSPSQIYSALDVLVRRSLIEEVPAQEVSPGVLRQPKPHYRATPEGMHSYQEWLISQIHDERRRSRLFARELAMLEVQDALAVIERYEHACLREASSAPIATSNDPSLEPSGELIERILTEENRLSMGAKLAWIEYVRSELTAATSKAPRRVASGPGAERPGTAASIRAKHTTARRANIDAVRGGEELRSTDVVVDPSAGEAPAHRRTADGLIAGAEATS